MVSKGSLIDQRGLLEAFYKGRHLAPQKEKRTLYFSDKKSHIHFILETLLVKLRKAAHRQLSRLSPPLLPLLSMTKVVTVESPLSYLLTFAMSGSFLL